MIGWFSMELAALAAVGLACDFLFGAGGTGGMNAAQRVGGEAGRCLDGAELRARGGRGVCGVRGVALSARFPGRPSGFLASLNGSIENGADPVLAELPWSLRAVMPPLIGTRIQRPSADYHKAAIRLPSFQGTADRELSISVSRETGLVN